MKISFKFGVVRHCPDLTDPKAGSVPIALIATGEVRPGEGFVFVGVGKNPFLATPDPLGVYRDLPEFFLRTIERGRSTAESAKLMDWFQGQLRGTLFVPQIEERSLNVRAIDSEDLVKSLVGLFHAEVTQGSRPRRRKVARPRRPLAGYMPDVRFASLARGL